MHKRLLNEVTIELMLEPDGPILIKSGREGADPTHPDMQFVRTVHPEGGETVYLPGPSLKGVVRAHCERIVRSLDESAACNPVDRDSSCSEQRFRNGRDVNGTEAYARSCFVCKLFGNTALAGRLRTADAYPIDPDAVHTEERDGVAIDRVYGSVAFGPFNFEVATSGTFRTTLHLHNVTLAQLGLVGLVLRDLKLGRVAIGFGKSRGLGRVRAGFDEMTIRYPTCTVANGDVTTLAGTRLSSATELAGVGLFPDVEEEYEFPSNGAERAALPDGLRFEADGWLEANLSVSGEQVEDVWRACMPAWQAAMGR